MLLGAAELYKVRPSVASGNTYSIMPAEKWQATRFSKEHVQKASLYKYSAGSSKHLFRYTSIW